jgi:membrane protease YdiL (CAAX protease family)
MIALWTKRLGSTLLPLSLRATGLLAFVILVAAVVAISLWVEKLSWSEIGFGRLSWRSVLWGGALAVFLVFVYGPVATAALARFGGTFSTGAASLAGLPRWYLASAIAIVAAGEEWLYRGYALERLQALSGSIWIACGVSLLAFAAAHLPLWGLGPSLTTLISGGVLTALYVWRRDISFLILGHVATDLYGLVIAPPIS